MQNTEAEIAFFNRITKKTSGYDALPEDIYTQVITSFLPLLTGKILEAGCGTGAFGLRLKKRCPQLKMVGADINPRFAEIARQAKIYHPTVCADLENSQVFGRETFDVIFASYLLHHFPDIDRVVHNFYRWLKPGGLLLIADVNGSNPVIKTSYLIRIFLARFVDMSVYASVNEGPKSVADFNRALKRFKIVSIRGFDTDYRPKITWHKFSWLNFYAAAIRQNLFTITRAIPFLKHRDVHLMIVAKKL